jgi:hypothetical protein
VAGRIDAFLKLSVIAGVLVASSSVAYYYVVYLPRRDAQLDVEQAWVRARADAERRAERERSLSEQRAVEQRVPEQRASEQGASEEHQATENATAQTGYQMCLSSAQSNYIAAWTTSCTRLGVKDRAKCLSESYGSKELCDTMQRDRDVSPDCWLPRAVGTHIKTELKKARDHCLQEK